jgi:hypothetical protein
MSDRTLLDRQSGSSGPPKVGWNLLVLAPDNGGLDYSASLIPAAGGPLAGSLPRPAESPVAGQRSGSRGPMCPWGESAG